MKGDYEMREYIETKINELKKISNPENYLKNLSYNDVELEKKWRRDQSKDRECWDNINSNEDVINLIELFDGQVRFIENNVPYGAGIDEDGYKMALAEYRVVRGLQKMAQFIGKGQVSKVNFTLLSETEIDALFDRVKEIIIRKNRQNERRGYEDRR